MEMESGKRGGMGGLKARPQNSGGVLEESQGLAVGKGLLTAWNCRQD